MTFSQMKEEQSFPCSAEEWYRLTRDGQDKIITPEETTEFFTFYRLKCKFVLTNGVFDCLGPHHIRILKFAKSLGGQLIVAVNSDASVKRLKGEDRPILPLEDRIFMLSELECVDFVVSFDEDTPAEIIKKIMPSTIVKGGDYQAKDVVGAEIIGVENIVIFPTIEGYSTTKLIQRLKGTE